MWVVDVINWRFIVHEDLTIAEEICIAKLKDQYWKYGLESQIRWMKENIRPDDLHLVGEVETNGKIKIQAYSTLSNIQVSIDEKGCEFIGIGNVCVEKSVQHLGIGMQLMDVVGKYLDEKKGILLCKDALVCFYEKNGWKSVRYQQATVKDQDYKNQIMLFKRDCNCKSIIISRNF